MKKSAFISDVLFAFFCAFLATLCIFRYAGVSLTLAFVLSILCGVLTAGGVGAYLQSRRKTVFLKKSDEAQKEKLLFHLAMLSDEGKTKFFLERLSTEKLPVKRVGALRLSSADAYYLLRFNLAPVHADELLVFSRLKTKKDKIVLCSKIEESAYALAERLGITVKTGEQVYALLKERNALPTSYLSEESETNKRKRKLRLWFSKNNAKRYLTASGLLVLTAFISPFPYYYFISAGVLLLTAVFIRIFGYV
ncbi:MAG: hypothetical protein IKZ28_01855 [Clostridia bacterium]|nr:hypothetical protein [Clostridia bacterium]